MKSHNTNKEKLNMNKNVLLLFFLLTLTIQSCTMLKTTVSDKRNPVPQKFVLNKDVELTTWGAIKNYNRDVLPSSFKIKATGKVIFIDPVMINDIDKADYIFITHAHADHFSIKDIKKIVKTETIFICPKGVSKKLSKYNYTIKEVKPGDTLDLDNIKCEAVAAYNINPYFLWIKIHPKSKQNVGYILTLNNDIRIYHAGDTDYIPEMNNIKNITVALIPIGGENLTMNVADASKLVNEIKPEIVIPMHYKVKKREDLVMFKRLVEKGIQVIILE